MLRSLNQRLFRSIFVDKSLRSVGDGLLVAGTGGQIVFVNRERRTFLDKTTLMLGSSLWTLGTSPEKRCQKRWKGCWSIDPRSSRKSRRGSSRDISFCVYLLFARINADRGRGRRSRIVRVSSE